MKAVAEVVAATAFASLAALGQGQFVFNNRVLPDINARFIANSDPVTGTTSSIGDQYQVQLFNYVNGQLIPLDPASTGFRGPAGTAAAGYVIPVTVTVPGVLAGQTARVELRLAGPGMVPGCDTFGPYTVLLGGGVAPPPNLPLGTTPLIVSDCPEPSTAVLALTAIGAIWVSSRLRRCTHE